MIKVAKSAGVCGRLGKVRGSYTELWKLRPERGKGNFLFWAVHLLVLGGTSPFASLIGFTTVGPVFIFQSAVLSGARWQRCGFQFWVLIGCLVMQVCRVALLPGIGG